MKQQLLTKTVIWIGNSKKNIIQFPLEVKRTVGHALYFAQLGSHHPSAKIMKGLGSGIYEVIKDYRGDTYRAVYTVRFADTIYVLHAFQKKSKTGIKTPQEDINLIKERLKRAEEIENGKF